MAWGTDIASGRGGLRLGFRFLGDEVGELEAAAHVQPHLAVGLDVNPQQRVRARSSSSGRASAHSGSASMSWIPRLTSQPEKLPAGRDAYALACGPRQQDRDLQQEYSAIYILFEAKYDVKAICVFPSGKIVLRTISRSSVSLNFFKMIRSLSFADRAAGEKSAATKQ